MSHAYLIEFKHPDRWVPGPIVIAQPDEFQHLMDIYADKSKGEIHGTRWRRLHTEEKFAQYVDAGSEIMAKDQPTPIDWN